MNYKIIKDLEGKDSCILATPEIGESFFIPINEGNADYQQYLVDTDGGLPLPKETK